MANQPMNNNVNQKGKSKDQWQDSGSDYHREHASNVSRLRRQYQDTIAKTKKVIKKIHPSNNHVFNALLWRFFISFTRLAPYTELI